MKTQYKTIRALTQSKNKALKSKVITQAKKQEFQHYSVNASSEINTLKVLTV
jgi:hypothetical protein